MPAPFWLHCNVCAMPFNKNKRFYFLSCYHIACKNCLINSEGGKKCPSCKKAIKFQELTKLPEKLKAYFKPNIISTLDEPFKMIKFQQDQQKNLFKLTYEFKAKCKKAAEVKAKLAQEIETLKMQCEKTIRRRKLMQQKLKEIYLKQQKERSASYRTRMSPQSMSSGPSKQSSSPASYKSPSASGNRPIFNSARSNSSHGSANALDFFDKKSPTIQKSGYSSGSSSASSSKPRSSQSNRKPFFA